jgi:YbbR domain-containing protein
MSRHNLRYKLLALAIAVIIWIYADANQSHDVTKHITDVTVQLRNLEPGYLASCRPSRIKVMVKSKKADVNQLVSDPEALIAYVDLSGRTAGQYSTPVKIKIPGELNSRVEREAIPSNVTVVLEKKVSRLFKIEIKMLSETSKDYTFTPPMISSSNAVVSGSLRLINSIDKLVVPLDPGESASSIDGEFSVMAVDSEGKDIQGVQINPDKVHLVMKLIEAPISKIAYIVPDIIGQPQYPYVILGIDIHPQTVIISGKPADITDISTVKTSPINLDGKTKTFSQSVKLIMPKGVKLDNNDSVRVTIYIDDKTNAELGKDKDKAPE